MKNYVIIAGLNDKNSRKQEITTVQAKRKISEIILKYAGGATLTECEGIYTHDDGGIVIEKSIKIEISGIKKASALMILAEIKTALNQESIFFTSYRSTVKFL